MIVAGSCLCGIVAYEARLPFLQFVNCYCSRCRKATGNAYAANALVKPDAFLWIRGEDKINRYDLPTAHSFATSVCSRCGSPVPHFTRSGREVIIPAGSLDSDPGEKPSRNVHWSSRVPWLPPPGDLPTSG